MKTAEFLDYINGEVKLIILEEGESIDLNGGGETDEGFHYWGAKYTHDGDSIICEYHTRSRDCDGPMETCRMAFCLIDELSDPNVPVRIRIDICGPDAYSKKYFYPRWQELSSRQKDTYAETMNY